MLYIQRKYYSAIKRSEEYLYIILWGNLSEKQQGEKIVDSVPFLIQERMRGYTYTYFPQFKIKSQRKSYTFLKVVSSLKGKGNRIEEIYRRNRDFKKNYTLFWIAHFGIM